MLNFFRKPMGWLAISAILLGAFALWAGLHYWIVAYGTDNVPLTRAYVGDEQAPLSGALHMAQAKSLFAMQGRDSDYYGPVFSALVAPAVALDYLDRMRLGLVKTAEDYKLSYTLDWGRALFKARWISVLCGFIGLIALWYLLSDESLNPRNKKTGPILGVLLLATNFYYFLYSGWLRHWIFLTVFLVAQFLFLVKIKKSSKKIHWFGFLAVSLMGFGISMHSALIYQIMWLPLLYNWARNSNWRELKKFLIYLILYGVGLALIIFWNPTPYFRLWAFSEVPTTHLAINPLPVLGYYLGVIVFNQPFLAVSFLAGLFLAFKTRLYKEGWFWMMALPALAHLILFPFLFHAEPRYIMPVTAVIIILCVCILQRSEMKRLGLVVAGLLAAEIAFQSAMDFRWSWLASFGPEEKIAISYIRSVEDKSRILFFGHILGASHTKESYVKFVQVCIGANPADLFKYLTTIDPPGQPKPLSVDYVCREKSSGGPGVKYDYFLTPVGFELASNFFEERTLRMWFSKDLRLTYKVTGTGGATKDLTF
ncbi:MAG: hypothetical protein PHC70_03590 [Patescibacteria group bacterium]|nr:hypothetical protein [Patescibacteria group bacterium]